MATSPDAAAAELAAAAPAKKKLPLWLLIAAAVLVLGGGAGGFWLWHARSAAHTKVAKAPSGPPHYLALKPFVVNFQGSQQARFLQVAMQVMSRDPKTLKLIEQNDPMVRNNLLLLLGNQQYATLDTETGKQQLRSAVLAAIRHVVATAGGQPNQVAAVYFTSFVMQ